MPAAEIEMTLRGEMVVYRMRPTVKDGRDGLGIYKGTRDGWVLQEFHPLLHTALTRWQQLATLEFQPAKI